jgi:hypothetical protein
MAAEAPTGKAPTSPYPGAGSADPYSASFYANQAALEFQRNTLEAEDQRAIRETNANYNYNRGLNERAEPLKLTANRNAANTQGLAESGILAKTQGLTQTDYAQKGARLGETRRNAVEKYTQGEKTAREDFNIKTAGNVAKEQENQLKEAEANPPQPAAVANPVATGDQLVGGTSKYGGQTYRFTPTIRPESAVKWSRNPTVRAAQERAQKAKGVG